LGNELNRVPTTLIDYAAYLGNSRLMGTGEVTLPSISAITSDVSGAGIGGKVEMPVMGHFDSMTLGISFRTVELAAAELMIPEAKDIVLRASQQIYDGAGGSIKSEGVVVYARVMPKSNELGALKPGDPIDGKVELEVLRIRVVKAGVELYEIDKLNGIYKVLGFDYTASVRADLGV
jgi:hypothetical protein